MENGGKQGMFFRFQRVSGYAEMTGFFLNETPSVGALLSLSNKSAIL